MASTTEGVILFFDKDWGLEEGDTIVEAGGDLKMVLEPMDLLDFIDEVCANDPQVGPALYVSEFVPDSVNVDGSQPSFAESRRRQNPKAVICCLQSGKDVWHGFNDYEDAVNNGVVPAIGSVANKFRALKTAREYFPPAEGEKAEYNRIDRIARRDIRKWAKRTK